MPGGHRAVSVLYQGLLTGLVLTLVTRRGADEAGPSSSSGCSGASIAQGEEVEIEVAAGRTVIREPIRGSAST